MEWNESNFDVNFCPYAARAYKEKRYGFLSDVARLKIIYENGGVYLDTDVEVKRSLEELSKYDAWFCYSDDNTVNTGSGFGAVAGNWMVEKLLNQYLNFEYEHEFELCTRLDTPIFKMEFPNFGRKNGDEKEYKGIILIYNIWKYSEHHYMGTWRTRKQYIFTACYGFIPSKIKKLIGRRDK